MNETATPIGIAVCFITSIQSVLFNDDMKIFTFGDVEEH